MYLVVVVIVVGRVLEAVVVVVTSGLSYSQCVCGLLRRGSVCRVGWQGRDTGA